MCMLQDSSGEGGQFPLLEDAQLSRSDFCLCKFGRSEGYFKTQTIKSIVSLAIQSP